MKYFYFINSTRDTSHELKQALTTKTNMVRVLKSIIWMINENMKTYAYIIFRHIWQFIEVLAEDDKHE